MMHLYRVKIKTDVDWINKWRYVAAESFNDAAEAAANAAMHDVWAYKVIYVAPIIVSDRAEQE